MLESYVNENKNIIIIGGTKAGRQKVLLEAVSLIDNKERIAVIEKALEIPKEKLFKDNCNHKDIITIQTSELSIDDQTKIEQLINGTSQNAVAVSSIEDVEYIIKHILPNSKYTIMAYEKLTSELDPYADVVVQLKDDDTLDVIKEKNK